MKKFLLTLTGFIVTLLSIAQSPNLMNYQGVARNAAGNVLPNQNIALRLSIVSGTPTGAAVYSETRTLLTNAFGLFNVVVGSPGATNVTGTIAGINWTAFGAGSGAKYLRVEIDPVGGTSFVNVGSTQLVSVPYALNAGSAAPVGPAGGDLTGTYPNPTILIPFLRTQSVPGNTMIGMINSATTGTLGALQGTSASTDANAVAIQGTMSSTAPGSFSTAVKGVNNGTGGLGIGVWGAQAGSGYGVYGTTPNGWSVIGETTTGYGVWGTASTTGIGVYGRSNTNTAGLFENTNAASTATTLAASSNGSGTTVTGTNTGTGRGGFFQVNNAASTANALEATTNGTGASWAIRGNSSGTNGAGLFVQSNAANTANNVQSNQAGLGRAGLFQSTNTASTADALTGITNSNDVTAAAPPAVRGISGTSGIGYFGRKGVWGETSDGQGVAGSANTGVGGYFASQTGVGVVGFTFGTGAAINGTSISGPAGNFTNPAGNASNVINVTTAGTGIAANISNTNAANTGYTTQIENANTSNTAIGNATMRVGRGAVLANTFVFSGIPTASWGISSTGIGTMGSTATGIGTAGLTNTGVGVQAYANGAGGIALVGQAANATGYGLVTIGRVQIQGQGAAVNRVLTSDNVGNATWNPLSAVGGVSGSGTLNFMPKWTPDGTTIGNSQMFDNGTNIGLGTVSPNARFDIPNAAATTRGIQVLNSVVSNNSSAIYAQTNNITSGSFFEGAAVTGVMPLTVGSTMASGGTAVKGIASTNAAVSQFSGIGVQGVSAAGYGVIGNSNDGVGLAGIGWGTGYGLYTFGKLQFEGQGAAANRVMTSTDANGNAVWNTLAAVGGVSGTGTLNYIPKWSPNGTTLGNSLAFDNGLYHSIGSTTVTPGDLFHVSNSTGSTWASINQVGTNIGGFGFSRANSFMYDFYLNAANDYNIFNYTSGTNALTILGANANVGINQVNPTAKLDVNGTFKLTDGTQGANKVLTSDAAGNASWQVIPGALTKISSAWVQSFDAPSRDTTIDGTLTKVYFIAAPELTPAVLATGNVSVYFRVGSIGPYELPYISNAGGRANAIQAILMPGKIAITRPTFNETSPNNINLPATLEFRYTIIQ